MIVILIPQPELLNSNFLGSDNVWMKESGFQLRSGWHQNSDTLHGGVLALIILVSNSVQTAVQDSPRSPGISILSQILEKRVINYSFSSSLLILHIHLCSLTSSYNYCFLITLNPQTNKWIDCLKSGQFAHSLIQVHVCSFRTHFYLTNSPCLNFTVFPPLSYLKCWKLKNTFLWNE